MQPAVFTAACGVYGLFDFLLRRFAENGRKRAGCSASHGRCGETVGWFSAVVGLTTVSGFMALVLMQFKIGPDMGWVMAKAIVLSLICVLSLLPALTVKAVAG